MEGITRRRLIQLTGAAGLSAMAPFGIVPMATASALAVALAVAAVIAGMIAANNRRSVEAMMLGAINEKLQVATEQLASLQSAVSFLLQNFGTLRNDIEEMLRRQSVIEKQNDIKTNINIFSDHLRLRSQYPSDEAWLQASNRKKDLEQILRELTKARVSLQTSSSALDPTSALVLAPCALAELSLMNICRYDKITFADRIRSYETHFRKVKDASINESTAWYLADRRASKEKELARLGANPWWQAELSKPDGRVTLCAFHQPTKDRSWDVFPSQSRISQRLLYREINVMDDPAVKAQLSQLKIPLLAENATFPIRQLEFEPGPDETKLLLEGAIKMGKNYLVGDSLVPTPTPQWKWGVDCTPALSAPPRLFGLSDATAALAKVGGDPKKLQEEENAVDQRALENSAEWRGLVSKRTELLDNLERINIDTAKIAYANEALAAVDAVQQRLDVVKRTFK